MKLDQLDLEIIKALQRDARIRFVNLSKELHVSVKTINSRYEKMKYAGVIKGTTIIIDLTKMNKYLIEIEVETSNENTDKVIEIIKKLTVENSQDHALNRAKHDQKKKPTMQIFKTAGHYTIIATFITTDSMLMHRIKSQIKGIPSVIYVNASVVTEHFMGHENLSLKHLIGDQ